MRATSSRKDAFRMRFLPVFLLGLLVAPATAMAAEEGGAGGTDYTTQIMLALVIVLMILMVVIGALETRKPH
jgi:hypothetical protein